MASLLAQPDRGTLRDSWPKTQRGAEAKIEQFGTTIDYIKLCAGTKVIFLGQTALSRSKVCDHLCENAAALKEAGVTHFAIQFNEKPLTDYSRLCCELHTHGIKIIIDDADQQRMRDSEQRAAHMTKSIMDILEAEPKAKVAALFSSFHAGRYISDGLRPVAVRIESAKYSSIRLMYCCGDEHAPTDFTQPASCVLMEESSFALDMRPYGADAPFGGDCDFVLYLGS